MGPRSIFADKLFMVYQLTGVSLAVICKKERTRRRYLPPTVIVLSQEYLLVEMDRESALGKSIYRASYIYFDTYELYKLCAGSGSFSEAFSISASGASPLENPLLQAPSLQRQPMYAYTNRFNIGVGRPSSGAILEM